MASSLGSWLINYIPAEGGRFTGELTVDDEKVRFVSIYESSNKTIVKAIFLDVTAFAVSGGHLVYRYFNDTEAVVDLPVSEISAVKAAKKGITKRAVITMKTGEEFVFDYGILPVRKLVETVESIINR